MNVLIKPIISEKMTKVADEFNRYGFIVDRKATKSQIKAEVEDIYGVKVRRVNTLIQRGKASSRYTKTGVITGKKNTVKKAIVEISKEEKIDFFSNI
ncbi:MAG TPA: 50S ribosomal protein L23 [Bacteroidales bacterium]|jgi:large subunit ribosomal protein L23|nr:50S ribosomal protein L23 [Bacteroidales bacterium]HOF45699.1 50S ribosomal protein L23 [Bacteroidales bacterium]HOS58266.1 50S ribosomal protein L23 [Bacteroidales bacterium]HRR04175.1 50S ribosomal protein L23 [Bacteroidales bacterium]HRT13827.1 50S ribosomal protein L23 [Bacteroidales bacterium]